MPPISKTSLHMRLLKMYEKCAGSNAKLHAELVEEGRTQKVDAGEVVQSECDAAILAAIADQTSDEPKRILRALSRIRKGTYGKCLNCDADISPKRLNANPCAELCLECQQELEDRNRTSRTQSLVVPFVIPNINRD